MVHKWKVVHSLKNLGVNLKVYEFYVKTVNPKWDPGLMLHLGKNKVPQVMLKVNCF